MSDYLLIKKVYETKPVDQSVIVRGWIKSLRQSKKFSFMVLNDGSTQKDLQIIVDGTLPNYEEVSKLLLGSSVEVTGKVVAANNPKQPVEMQATNVMIYCANSEDYPLQKKETSLEYLREIAHLRSRTNTFSAVFRLRHELAMATHEFFSNENFYYLHTPVITASDAEGAGEMFRVSTLPFNNTPKTDKGAVDFSKDYFGRETFLSVSGQLEAETVAMGMGRVYTFGPTFRSENSNTARHLSEFWMVEPEAAFNTLEDNAKLATNYVKHLIRRSIEKCGDELEFLASRYSPDNLKTLEHVMNSPFETVTYTDAIKILEEVSKTHKFDFPVKWGIDLQTEHERFLAEHYFKRPTIVTDYPKDIKAFYMKLNEDGKTVRAMDVLVPGVGELIGGSQREDNLERLVKRMEEMKMDTKNYWWYLDLRKYGSVPHSGFGLGFERALMYISGMTNIRDVIPYPRFPKNAEF